MAKRVYITLKEASEHLQARGLTGQTLLVLRQAAHDGKLAAIKDGRSWKTTIVATNEYEVGLWRSHAMPSDAARKPAARKRAPPKPWRYGRLKTTDPEGRERYLRATAWARGERLTWR